MNIVDEVVYDHPADVVEYLTILYNFLNIATDNFELSENKEVGHSITIEGFYGELFRLIKVKGLYTMYIKDSNDEALIELDNILTMKEFLDGIKFHIIRVSYAAGIEEATSRDFEIDPAALPLDLINIPNDEKFQREAMILKLGEIDVPVIQSCFKNYKLTKFIGKGSYGSVFSACIGNKCDYAIKVLILGGTGTVLGQVPAIFIREAKMIEKLSSMGVGPKFYEAWMCKLPGIVIGCIATELWSGELMHGECLSQDQILKLEDQISKINSSGNVHGDIFTKNVLVKRRGGKVIDVTLNDFGTLNTAEAWREMLIGGRRDFFDLNYMESPENSHYFIDSGLSFEDVAADPRMLDSALTYYLRKTCL